MTEEEFNEKHMKIIIECIKLAKNNNLINLIKFDNKIKELNELEKKFIEEIKK